MKSRFIFFTLLAGMMMFAGCASWNYRPTKRSTSVVAFLYPDKQPFVEPSIPTLSLPMRVGVAFVPTQSAPGAGILRTDYWNRHMPEAAKDALMRTVSAQFKALPYVHSIEMIPTFYLRPGGSFGNLDQLRSLLGIDAIVLLAYDQQQITTDRPWLALSYWTIVGAYTVNAQRNSTSTLMEAVVYDIASRKLLFRAAGASLVNENSSLVGSSDRLLKDSGKGFDEAASNLGKTLQAELENFKARLKESPEEIKVVAKPGYNLAAGAFGAGEMLLLAIFIAAIFTIRMKHAGKKPKRALTGLLSRNSHLVVIIMLLGVAFGSSGCVSGAILMTRKNETTIFNEKDANKPHIEKHLGAPVSSLKYDSHISIYDIRKIEKTSGNASGGFGAYIINGCYDQREYKELFLNRVYIRDNPENLSADTPIVECATYVYRGRVIPTGMIHERGVMGGHTLLLSEVAMIPAALYTVTTGWTRVNVFKVWYDKNGRAWAYVWEPTKSTAK